MGDEWAYEEGYRIGNEDGYIRGFDDGYEKGFREAEANLSSLLHRAAMNPLEEVVVRWDAPEGKWILSQDGREVALKCSS